MVVDHNDIELEVGFLTQGAVHGIHDGLLAVVDRDDYRGLDAEVLLVKVWTAIEGRIDLRTDSREMGRSGMFHLDLHLAVSWIHIVELLDTRCPEVGLFLRIQAFVDVEDAALAAQEEAQGIEARILIVVFARLHGEGMEQRGLDEQQRAEIEVVADAAWKIVDGRMVFTVGIDHCGIRVTSHTEHTAQGLLSDGQSHGLRDEQHIVGLRLLGHLHDGVAAREVCLQKDVLYRSASTQLSDDVLGDVLVITRQEAVYFFSHFESLLLKYVQR